MCGEPDLSQEAYDDAVIEDTVHCKTCNASMLCGDGECFVVGNHSYCFDCVQDAVADREKRFSEAVTLLVRCWKAGHKEGWQDAETNSEVFDSVSNFLCDQVSPHWGEMLESGVLR